MLRSEHVRLVTSMVVLCLAACGGGTSKNAPPIANDLNLTVTEDMAAQGSFTATDPDGDTLGIQIVTAPTKGDVTTSSVTGLSFTYAPRANQNGSDTFSYRVNDGRANSNTATVTVAIAAVNDAPVIQQSLSLDEDQPSSTLLIAEPDGETFSSQIVTQPAHGTLVQDTSTPGRFTYTPAANFNGSDSFALRAVDASSMESSQTVAVTVRPVNDAPVASADQGRTVQGQSVRLTPLANDTDLDGDALSLSIAVPPSTGTATVSADGSIQYTPTSSFVGNTSLEYQARDPAGATSNATLSIAVGLTSAILYRSQGGLHFTDGARSFAVSAPLRVGETIQEVRPAQASPIVFYSTLLNTVTHLFRVDLRRPNFVEEIDQPMAFPGIQEFTIDSTGSRVAYHLAGRLNFVDFSDPAVVRDLGDGQRSLFMNPAGTHVFYAGLITAPSQASGALFVVDTSGTSSPHQITSTVTAPDTTSGVIYLNRNEDRVYYSVASGANKQLMAVNPNNSGSEFIVQGPVPANELEWKGITQDESTYWFRSLAAREDYYLFRIGTPGSQGSPVNMTIGTANGQIYSQALSADGSRFYYTRSNGSGVDSRLYRVDTSNTSTSTPIGGTPSGYFGVSSFALAHDGASVVYATLDRVSMGGGLISGSSDVFFLDLSNPNSPALVHHFDGAATVETYAPDNSFVILTAAEQLGGADLSYVLNLRDRTQLLTIDGSGAVIVPNF